MSLIKRSVVLYKDNTKGVLTVIRLGETIGAKLVLNESPKNALWLGLKLGDGRQHNYKIIQQITEFKPDSDLSLNDSIGAILIDGNGSVYAYGGMREKVSISLIKDTINEIKATQKDIIPQAVQNTAVPQTEPAAAAFEPEAAKASAVSAEVAPEIQEENEMLENVEPHPSHDMPPIPDDEAKLILEVAEKTVTEPMKPKIPLPPEPIEEPDEPEPIEELAEPEPPEDQIVEQLKPNNKAEQRAYLDTSKKQHGNPFNIPKAKNFYQAVRGRLEEIMTINPKETELEKLIPDSEWVKVRYDGEEYYVVGRLYENNVVTYLGYGVPGMEHISPPKEAEELCDFLPLPGKKGVGYWLMFQKADDGTISKDLQ